MHLTVLHISMHIVIFGGGASARRRGGEGHCCNRSRLLLYIEACMESRSRRENEEVLSEQGIFLLEGFSVSGWGGGGGGGGNFFAFPASFSPFSLLFLPLCT